jgi:hypothetical protein
MVLWSLAWRTVVIFTVLEIALIAIGPIGVFEILATFVVAVALAAAWYALSRRRGQSQQSPIGL